MDQDQTALKRWLVNIWPSIYKKINSFFYWLMMLIRRTISSAIDQIR